MKKLLALMCIAIAALIWLPGLKFPVEAGGIDYEEMVLVESGEDVTLSINLSKLNLPAGFEVVVVTGLQMVKLSVQMVELSVQMDCHIH